MGKSASKREGEITTAGRRKIVGEVIEDHTILIFKLALARRLLEIIMRDGLMTSVYDHYASFHRIMEILEGTREIVKEDKTWLLRVRDELDRRLADPEGS